jgi:tRNA G26 N,N-dimethylase Trm1
LCRKKEARLTDLDPAKPPPPILERAYELARSGQFSKVSEIFECLRSEGYQEVYLHFDGPALRADLSRICRQSQAASDELNFPEGSNSTKDLA